MCCINHNAFHESKFLFELKNLNLSLNPANQHQCHDQIINEFLEVVKKHASIKKKTVGGNDTPFMNKELKKAIEHSKSLRNKFCKYPTKKMSWVLKKQHKWESLRRKSIKT